VLADHNVITIDLIGELLSDLSEHCVETNNYNLCLKSLVETCVRINYPQAIWDCVVYVWV